MDAAEPADSWRGLFLVLLFAFAALERPIPVPGPTIPVRAPRIPEPKSLVPVPYFLKGATGNRSSGPGIGLSGAGHADFGAGRRNYCMGIRLSTPGKARPKTGKMLKSGRSARGAARPPHARERSERPVAPRAAGIIAEMSKCLDVIPIAAVNPIAVAGPPASRTDRLTCPHLEEFARGRHPYGSPRPPTPSRCQRGGSLARAAKPARPKSRRKDYAK